MTSKQEPITPDIIRAAQQSLTSALRTLGQIKRRAEAYKLSARAYEIADKREVVPRGLLRREGGEQRVLADCDALRRYGSDDDIIRPIEAEGERPSGHHGGGPTSSGEASTARTRTAR